MSAPKSRLELERIALGEAPGSGSERERADLQALANSNREILQALPVEEVVREVERRRRVAGIKGPLAHRRLGWALAAWALAAAVFMFFLMQDDSTSKEVVATHQGDPYQEPGEIRSKGDPRLLVHLQTADGPVELSDQSEAAAGDLLQLSYLAAQKRFGVVLSVDGRGAITQHFPEAGSRSAALQREGKAALPSSYELDDAPEFERFYFVSAQTSFEVELVRLAIEASSGHELRLDDRFHQVVFHLRKSQP